MVEEINESRMKSSATASQSIDNDPIEQAFSPKHQGHVRRLRFGVNPSNVGAITQSKILV
ncbi:hypothetical protein Scep_012106 [Stephania cephalantha]|uniref:Uncharacterized protein n=1 Tax=Stephania cephalantha TaxID=152367 RepID=A0AAP0P6F8_9MAGN